MDQLKEKELDGTPDTVSNAIPAEVQNASLPTGGCHVDAKLQLLVDDNLIDSGIVVTSSITSENSKGNSCGDNKNSNSKATTPASDCPDLSELPNDVFCNENENAVGNSSAVTSENENCSADQITSISDSLFEINDSSDTEDLVDDVYEDSIEFSIDTNNEAERTGNVSPLVLTENNSPIENEIADPSDSINLHPKSDGNAISPIPIPDSLIPNPSDTCERQQEHSIEINDVSRKSANTGSHSLLDKQSDLVNNGVIISRNGQQPIENKGTIETTEYNAPTDPNICAQNSRQDVCKDNIMELPLSPNNTDTTQRTVHDQKGSKPKEDDVINRKEGDTGTSSGSSASNLVSKPPSGVTTSTTQSFTTCPTPPVVEGGVSMAFTVDFGDSVTSDSSGSAGANKRLQISGPLSQFAPKHRRNLSLNKVEEHKKAEERKIEKPPVGRPRSNTAGATALCNRRGGYHSEGYFSSDQEDEAAKKADTKSPRSPKSAGAPSVNRSSAVEAQKPNVLRARPESPSNSYTVPLTESANFLIEKMLTATPELKRKTYGRSEGRACCKERKPSVPELSNRLNRSQEKISSPKSESESSPRNSKSSPTFSDPSKEDKDDASDAGTYTIDKDSPEVEEARNGIGRVFGVITESDAEMTSSTAVPHSTTTAAVDDESWLSATESQKSKVAKVLSRNSPNWIQQWAESVTEQTKPAMKCKPSRSPLVSPRAQNSPQAPQPFLQDNLDVRPRRMLPTPPQYSSPRNYHKEPIYEQVQHSTPKTKQNSSKSFRNYLEGQESGGDSDLDFRSYSFTDDERLTASLRDKLRLTSLNASCPKNLPSPRTSPRRFEQLQPSSVIADASCDKLDDNSYSSSETSDPYKEPSRIPDNNPPLKFNRAFSLRRARLNNEEPVPPKPAVEKKKNPRPSSAGNVRKGPLTGTRLYQSVDSSSSAVKSPSKTVVKREPPSKKGPRSNSTLTSKEVDFQNWKRRKNYDPMKAAAEGRKKQVPKTSDTKHTDQSEVTSDSPSPHNSLLRSASFHGTRGAEADIRWANKLNNHLQYTSEEDGPLSLEEEVPRRISSPLRRSPTSPSQLYSPALRHHGYSQGRSRGFRTPIESVEEDVTPHFQVAARKPSIEESGSEGKKSPLHSQESGGRVGNRSKTKMEALDNLVISTIHSLSVKVRTTAESLMLKMKSQYDEEGERAVLLQEVLAHLTESDQSLASQSRSTSRELAGILRNLKKVEHALQVVDRVMVTGDFLDDDDGEDIPNDWGESDY